MHLIVLKTVKSKKSVFVRSFELERRLIWVSDFWASLDIWDALELELHFFFRGRRAFFVDLAPVWPLFYVAELELRGESAIGAI